MLRCCFSSCLLKDDTVDATIPASIVQPVAAVESVSVVESNTEHTVAVTAQFCEGGPEYNITIACGPREGDCSPFRLEWVLSVQLNDQMFISVDNLRYNFRGNTTIFPDGTPVDVMWNLHNWLFSSPPGDAVFIFRPRLGENTTIGLCSEADMVPVEQLSGTRFTLSIEAFCGQTRVSVQ